MESPLSQFYFEVDLMTGSRKETLQTILVVDDHESVLKTAVVILEDANFRVLAAHSSYGAVRLSLETRGEIHMLLADVNMPHMSGPDLGETLKRTRPNIHVMLMSGGANGNLLVLNYGWAYIQQESIPAKLVEMIKYVLGTPNRSQLGGQEFDSRKDRS
jgi:DNA-binding NtrC family response regulator